MPTRSFCNTAPLLLSLLLTACQCGETLTTIPPQLGVEGDSVEFGPVAVGIGATRTFRIEALSAAELTVSLRIESDDGAFAFAGELPESVRGRSSVDVPLTFTPPSVGTFAAMLVIDSNDADENRGKRRILLSGQGLEPRIAVTPESVTLNAVACPPGASLAACSDEATITISNAGDVWLRLDEVSLLGAEGGELPPGLQLARAAEPQLLPDGASAPATLRWRPPPSAAEGGTTDFSAILAIASADPERPEVVVPITATARPNLPPHVCVDVSQAERLVYVRMGNQPKLEERFEAVPEEEYRFESDDGDTEIRVRPGMRVRLDTAPCTVDPEGDAMTLDWTLAKPDESSARLSTRMRADSELEIDAAGIYEVTVKATDSLGQSSTATLVIDAVPRDDLFVELRWPDVTGPAPDLDLHLVRGSAGSLFCEEDCFFGNPNPDWSNSGVSGTNPSLLRDDQGTGPRIESIVYPEVPADSVFRVVVHYWEMSQTPPQDVLPEISVRLEGVEHTFTPDVPLTKTGETWEVARLYFPAGAAPNVVVLYGSGTFDPNRYTGSLLACE